MKMYDDTNTFLVEHGEVFRNPFVLCGECGVQCKEYDLNEHGLCPDCADCYRTCVVCGDYMHEADMRGDLCEDCYAESENRSDPYADCMDVAHAALEGAL